MKKHEQQALLMGIAANLIMALAGWFSFFQTGIQALLLDGNFSMVAAVSCGAAIFISSQKKKKSPVFPSGYFVFEPLYALLKSVLMFLILVSSAVMSIEKLIGFIRYGNGEKIILGPVIPYSIAMFLICFGISGIYSYKNKKMGGASIILQTESKSSRIDGILSAGIGIAVFIVSLTDVNGAFGFLHYIGDSILTLVLISFSIKTPLELIRKSFIEIANGVVLEDHIVNPILDAIKSKMPTGLTLIECRVRKTGMSYKISAYLESESETVLLPKLRDAKQAILAELGKEHENVALNLILV